VALAEVANIAFLNGRADGETPAAAPRLSISQRLPGGHVQVTASGGVWGATRVIEASTDLVHWTPIGSNVLAPAACPDGLVIDFEDSESSALARRFYRAT